MWRWGSLLLLVLAWTESVEASMRFRGSTIRDVVRESNTASIFTNIGIAHPTTGIFCPGVLSTTEVCEEFRGRIPVNCRIQRVDATVTVAPVMAGVGQTTGILVDVNECTHPTTCASIWGPSERLVIPSGGYSGAVSQVTGGFIELGNWIGFDIDQVGNTTQGSHLTVTVVCE